MNEMAYRKLSKIVKALDYEEWNIPLNDILKYTGRGNIPVSVELDHTYICRVNKKRKSKII